MTDVLTQLVNQIGNVFESLTEGINAVLGDFSNLSSNIVDGGDGDDATE